MRLKEAASSLPPFSTPSSEKSHSSSAGSEEATPQTGPLKLWELPSLDIGLSELTQKYESDAKLLHGTLGFNRSELRAEADRIISDDCAERAARGAVNNPSLLANLAVAASSTHSRQSMKSGARVVASLELGSKAMVAKMRVMVKEGLREILCNVESRRALLQEFGYPDSASTRLYRADAVLEGMTELVAASFPLCRIFLSPAHAPSHDKSMPLLVGYTANKNWKQ
jgi:hypothetical protein